MSQLVLVRHAQASFFGVSYDALSPLGRDQALALGRHLATHGVRFERVYVGPRQRHRETCELVAAAYRDRDLPWPEAEPLAELDEHHGLAVIKHRLGSTTAGDAMHPPTSDPAERERLLRQWFHSYVEVMRDWAHGAIEVPGVEPWQEFRARAVRALELACASGASASGGAAARRIAFTSGGLVCAAVGSLLGLDEERVIDLSTVLRNTALTEVSWSARRRGLVSFNGLPHLPDASLATTV